MISYSSAVVNFDLVNKVVPPRPTTATSIPAMLTLFQNEWDAVMSETYTLKQQLDTVSHCINSELSFKRILRFKINRSICVLIIHYAVLSV